MFFLDENPASNLAILPSRPPWQLLGPSPKKTCSKRATRSGKGPNHGGFPDTLDGNVPFVFNWSSGYLLKHLKGYPKKNWCLIDVLWKRSLDQKCVIQSLLFSLSVTSQHFKESDTSSTVCLTYEDHLCVYFEPSILHNAADVLQCTFLFQNSPEAKSDPSLWKWQLYENSKAEQYSHRSITINKSDRSSSDFYTVLTCVHCFSVSTFLPSGLID